MVEVSREQIVLGYLETLDVLQQNRIMVEATKVLEEGKRPCFFACRLAFWLGYKYREES